LEWQAKGSRRSVGGWRPKGGARSAIDDRLVPPPLAVQTATGDKHGEVSAILAEGTWKLVGDLMTV
jgi:hypothetical protein